MGLKAPIGFLKNFFGQNFNGKLGPKIRGGLGGGFFAPPKKLFWPPLRLFWSPQLFLIQSQKNWAKKLRGPKKTLGKIFMGVFFSPNSPRPLFYIFFCIKGPFFFFFFF